MSAYGMTSLICRKKGKEGHFVGSIVNIAEQAMPTGVQKYMIIDGQQRITTMTLLLIALRDYALAHTDTRPSTQIGSIICCSRTNTRKTMNGTSYS